MRRGRPMDLLAPQVLDSRLAFAGKVVMNLMPGFMAKVGDFPDETLKPGTVIVTNTFLFRERRAWPVCLRALRGTVALYVWPGRHWTVKEQRHQRSSLRCMSRQRDNEDTIIFASLTARHPLFRHGSTRRPGDAACTKRHAHHRSRGREPPGGWPRIEDAMHNR